MTCSLWSQVDTFAKLEGVYKSPLTGKTIKTVLRENGITVLRENRITVLRENGITKTTKTRLNRLLTEKMIKTVLRENGITKTLTTRYLVISFGQNGITRKRNNEISLNLVISFGIINIYGISE